MFLLPRISNKCWITGHVLQIMLDKGIDQRSFNFTRLISCIGILLIGLFSNGFLGKQILDDVLRNKTIFL